MRITKALIIISVLFFAIILTACSGLSAEATDTFASCISEKGAKMYGAYWCGHCKAQKKMFGSSFAKVDYIECTVDPARCEQEGVQGFPTWKFSDGTRMAGVQDFSSLSLKTGCPLP